MGRPISDDPKTKNVTVRFTENELKSFNMYAKQKNTTKSALIREYVLGLIKK